VSETSFQKLCKLAQRAETLVWERNDDEYSLSIRVQTTINHISICFFFTPISPLKKIGFQSTS